MSKIKQFINFLNRQERWSDVGHMLMGYFVVSILGGSLAIRLIFLIGALIKEFYLDKHPFKTALNKSAWYLLGIGLA